MKKVKKTRSLGTRLYLCLCLRRHLKVEHVVAQELRDQSNVDVAEERFSATEAHPESSVEARFYTEKQLKSFWALLGIEDRNDSGAVFFETMSKLIGDPTTPSDDTCC